MIRNVKFFKVEDIALAVVPDNSDDLELFSTYILNLKEEDLQNVLIRARGVGEIEGKNLQTATLTVLLENVAGGTFVKIDSFEKEATALSNEYWISFRQNGYMYDKKYVFVAESIVEDNFSDLPLMNCKGVIIR
ncbi:MAG: hypothetical protein IPL35_03075 [Sphingobacteriales bacterium]|nr:hypothetical protein [Sphingobacteriales bacterium]